MAAPALLNRDVPLLRDHLVDHLKVHHQVAGRWLMTLSTEA
jgi:hypothetical protein